MSDSIGAPSGEPPNVEARPTIDVKAMPHILRRIVTLGLQTDPLQVTLAIVCSLGSAVASLAVPRLFGHAVDQIAALLKALDHARAVHLPAAQQQLLAQQSEHTLWLSAGLVIAVGIVSGLLTGMGGFQAEWVSQKVGYRLRLDFFRQLQRLSFGFHDKIHSGDLITRGMIDLEGTRMFIQNGLMMSVTLVLLVVVATWMMFATDPIMALLALAFVPVSIFTLARVGFLLRVAWMKVQNLMSVLTLTMEENLQGVRVVRSFAAKDFELGKFDKAADEALKESYKRVVLRMRAMRTTTFTFFVSQALVLWYGGNKV